MPDQPALLQNFFFLISKHIEYLLNEKVIINFHQCRFVCSLVQAMCRTASRMKDPTPSIEMHCICTSAVCLLEAMGENRETRRKFNKEKIGQEVDEKKQEDCEEMLVRRVSHHIPFDEASVTSGDGFPPRANDVTIRCAKDEPSPLTSLVIESDEKEVNREESTTFPPAEQENWHEEGHVFTNFSENNKREGGEYEKIIKWVTLLHADGLQISHSSPLPLLSPQRASRHRCEVEHAGSWPFLLLQHFNCENLFMAWLSRFEAGWKLHSPTEISTSWKMALELDKRKNAQILWQWFQPSMEFLCGQRRRYVPWVEGRGKRPPRESLLQLSLPKDEEGETDHNVEERTPSEHIGRAEAEDSPVMGDMKASAAQWVGKGAHKGKEEEEKQEMLTPEEIIIFYGNPQLRQWRILYEDLDYLSHPVSSPLLPFMREESTDVELHAGERYSSTLPSVHDLYVRWEEDGDAFQDFRGVPFVPAASSSSSSPAFSVSPSIRKEVKSKAIRFVETEYERDPHFLLERGLYWHHLPVQLQILEEKVEIEEEGMRTVTMKIEEEDKMLASQSARSFAVRETSMFFVEEAVLRCKWQFSGLVRFFGAFTEKICSSIEEKEQRLKLAFKSPPKDLHHSIMSSTFSENRQFDHFCTRQCFSCSESEFTTSSSFIPVAIPQIEEESSASSVPRLCLGLLREDLEKRREGVFQGKQVDTAYVPLSSLLYTDNPVNFSVNEVVDVVLQAVEIVQYLEADRLSVSQEIWRSWMTLSPSCLYVRKCHLTSSPLQFMLLPGSGEIISSSIALRRLEYSFPELALESDSVADSGHMDPYALPTATRAYTSSSSTTMRPFTATPSQRRRNQERFFEIRGERNEEKERVKQNGRDSFCWHVKFAPPCYVSNGVVSRWRPHPKAQSVACYALFQLFLALLTHRKPYDAEWFHRSATLDVSDVYVCLDEAEKTMASMECCPTKEGVLPGMLIPSTLSPAGKELYRHALCLDKTVAPMTLEAFKEGLLRWESENVF